MAKKVLKKKKVSAPPSGKTANAELEKVVAPAKAADKELQAYLKKNKLDPKKDWTKDKKHGKEIKRLTDLINTVGDKAVEKSKKIEKNPKEKPDVKGKGTKETKKRASTGAKYDYPLVDGKEMDADQKKKYRAQLRREAASSDKAKDKKKKDEKPVTKDAATKKDDQKIKKVKPKSKDKKKKKK